MADVVINYVKIIEALGEQLQDVWDALKESEEPTIINEISSVKEIEISDEQSFTKKRENNQINKGTVYVVVRFGSGSINYGSSVTPISLYVIGTANKVKPTQLLLSFFASSWTTKNLAQGLVNEEGEPLEISDALQVWNTPEVVTNFNEIDADFKNLFRLTGNIVVGPSAVRVGTITYYWGDGEGENETINIMAFQDGYRTSLDTQPFGNTFGFTESEVNFSTYTFSISTYLLSNHLTAAILAIRGFRNRNNGLISSIANPNDKLKIKIEFTNGFDNIPNDGANPNPGDDIWDSDFFSYFKVVDSQISQKIGDIPTLLITFAR